MTLILKEYGLPLDICLMIEKINYKEHFKLIFEELIEKINNNENYKSHEWYFIQMLSFLDKLNHNNPKFNDKTTYYIFNDDTNNIDLINYNHHLLYKDHMNIQLYQKGIYNIYYNYL